MAFAVSRASRVALLASLLVWGAVVAACSGTSAVRDVDDAGSPAPGDPGKPGAGSGDAGAAGDSQPNSGPPPASDAGDAAAASDAGDAAPTTYLPASIDFDDLPVGTSVTNQYQAHATFSTDPGATVGVYFNHDFGTGNYITTAIVNGNGGPSLFVDFAKPVRGLKFVVLAANASGPCASVNVFQRGAKTATVPILGAGNPVVNVPVDLSTYADVTRIEIVDVTDFDNLAYDHFTFSFPE